MEARVYPSGDLTLPSRNLVEFEKYKSSSFYQEGQKQNRTNDPSWIPLGPTGTVTNGDFAGADPIVNVPGMKCKHLTLQPGANMSVPEGNTFHSTTYQLP